jgi:hypothetical protein
VKKNWFKIGFLAIILLTLFVPLKRNVLFFIKERPLFGSYEFSEEPTFSLNDWFSGGFQEKYSNYFNSSFGFRNSLVRIFNQTQYSLFKKTSAKDTQIGRENYLFEGGYIRDYMGYNFIGEDKITAQLQKIKVIQEELKQDSISLFVAFAPGKASYFPGYFPSKYDTEKKTISNYLYYTQKCKELDLNYIDFNSMFMKHKTQSDVPIFPKGGIHWGEYAVAVSLDSLSRYLEEKRKINIPRLEMVAPIYYDTLRKEDRDISDAMNLLIELDYYKMPTPQYKVKQEENDVKPRLLIVGDSYGYGLTNSPIIHEQYSNVEFWYYNKEIKSGKKNHGILIEDIIVKNEVKRFDVILLLSTETNLYKFDFGFSESYRKSPESELENKIKKVIRNIKKNKEWLEEVKNQGKENNMTVDESLRKNAIFVIENRKQTK